MTKCEVCNGQRIVYAANTVWHPAGTVVAWWARSIINCPLCMSKAV